MPEHAIGDKITETPRNINDTAYLLLSREILEYMGFTEKEIADFVTGKNGLELSINFEKSPKWGQYIGVGKKGAHR